MEDYIDEKKFGILLILPAMTPIFVVVFYLLERKDKERQKKKLASDKTIEKEELKEKKLQERR